MLERRSMLILLFGLNVCLLIWRISVQEPEMIQSETIMRGYAVAFASNINFNSNLVHNKSQNQQQQQQQQQQQHQQQGNDDDQLQQQLYAGKHLLSEDLPPNEEVNSKHLQSHNNNIERSVRQSDGNINKLYSDYDSNNSLSNVQIKTPKKSLIEKLETEKVLPNSISNKRSSYEAVDNLPIERATIRTAPSTAGISDGMTNDYRTPGLPENDFSKLIDLLNFTYLMVLPSCHIDTKAIIFVHSAPANYEKRTLIRETWGSAVVRGGTPLRLIFLLGAVMDFKLQTNLNNENSYYNDMVQGSFIDDYRNMTYKHVMALKWFTYYCSNAQILIKVDDDVFLNTPKLFNYIKTTKHNQKYNAEDVNVVGTTKKFIPSEMLFNHPKNLIFCQDYNGSIVKRSYRSKWRVSFKEYAGHYYPPYCPGYAIFYSADVVFRLYNAAQKTKYFWIDDVQITGVLAQKININITTSANYILFSDECKRLLIEKTDPNNLDYLYAWHLITPEEIKQLWHLHIIYEKQKKQMLLDVD